VQEGLGDAEGVGTIQVTFVGLGGWAWLDDGEAEALHPTASAAGSSTPAKSFLVVGPGSDTSR
jgi:hypothetical protein